MSAAAIGDWRPRYDVSESREQFAVRQHAAYAAFEAAWQAGRVSLKLKAYYDQLVRTVGKNAYAWWGEDRLADAFGVSTRTIKRMLAALTAAGLIRRERQFRGPSWTFITAYDDRGTDPPWCADNHPLQPILLASPSPSLVCVDDDEPEADDHSAPAPPLQCTDTDHAAPLQRGRPASERAITRGPDSERARTDVETPGVRPESRIDSPEVMIDLDHYRQPYESFFGAKSGPTIGPLLAPDSIKTHTLTGGGGMHPPDRRSPIMGPIPATPAVAALRAMGTHDPGCLLELARRPIAEIHAACALARRVPHPEDLGALAVHFARQLRDGLLGWPAPTAGGAPDAHAKPRAARPPERTRRMLVCAQCRTRVVDKPGACCIACAHPSTAVRAEPTAAPPPRETPVSAAGDPLVPAPTTDPAALWQQVCATLSADAAGSDLALWLDGSVLLDVTGPTAILGVANVFVRDELRTRYASAVEAVLTRALDRAVSLSVVVDGEGT